MSWSNDFKSTCELAKWNQSESIEVLKTLIPSPLIEDIIIGNVLDASLDNLKNLEIGSLSLNVILNSLKNMYQTDFIFIHEYYDAIVQLVKKLTLITKYTKKEADHKVFETFMVGLHTETQLDLKRNKLNNIKDIIKFIQDQEEILLSYSSYQKKEENLLQKNDKITTQYQKATQYCPYHKSWNHSKEECNKIKELTKQKKYKPRTSNLQEKTHMSFNVSESQNIFTSIKINDSEYQSLVDTGASDNYMSEELCKELNTRPKEVNNQTIRFGNNSETCTTRKVHLEFSFTNSENSNAKYADNFYVLKDISHKIILGNSFLQANQAIINLPLKLINVNNYSDTIHFDANLITPNTLDTELTDKLTLKTINKKNLGYSNLENKLKNIS